MFVADYGAWVVRFQGGALANRLQLRVAQIAEKLQAAQMTLEHPFLIDLVHRLLIAGVFLDLVEDVSQKLQHVTIDVGDDRGGAGRQRHATHLAEDFALVHRRPSGCVVDVGRAIVRNRLRCGSAGGRVCGCKEIPDPLPNAARAGLDRLSGEQ